MLEILFRGKRKDNGEWVKGFYGINTICCEQSTYLSAVISKMPQGIYDYESWEVELETVGQYTGVTDKNGTKIFEGDIIESVSRLVNSVGTPTGGTDISRYIIEWGEHKWVKKKFFCNRCDYWKKNNVLPEDLYPNTASRYCEVIGNIYDNPELLEDGETE